MQSTVREPATTNMYKGVSTAYTLIIVSYWTLAFSGYWAFGSGVQPYILSSLTVPRWAIVMANIFAVVQITGCFQVTVTYGKPPCFHQKFLCNHPVTNCTSSVLHKDILQADIRAL